MRLADASVTVRFHLDRDQTKALKNMLHPRTVKRWRGKTMVYREGWIA